MLPFGFPAFVRTSFVESVRVYLILLKVLVPVILLVKALETVGGIAWLGRALAPLMGWLGLPDVLGVVLAVTVATSIVPGLVVFASVAADLPLSVAQMTVLGTLMLLAHSLPVEGAVARRAGVPWRTTLTLRIGGALLLGGLLHAFYTLTGRGQALVSLDWFPDVAGPATPLAWVLAQLRTLAVVFVVILALVSLLRLFRAIGVERLLHRVLVPPLRLVGIGPAAANVTVVGLVLGLSYGAGLLIRDVDDGVMDARDSYLAVCLLGLAHSLIDDTFLVAMLGADVAVIVVVRLVFAGVVVAVLARCLGPRASRAPGRSPGT